MAPRLRLLIFSGFRKEPKCAFLSEAWENVGRGFILRSTLPVRWTVYQHREVEVPAQGIMSGKQSGNNVVLYLIEGQNLTLIPRQDPDISSRVCRWGLPRFCKRLRCWFPSQRLNLFLRLCLETSKASSGPTNPEAKPFFASPSAVSLPLTL
jgi:hypothetical protein